MKGISDLLDSDMEDSRNMIDENSILSSASEAMGSGATKSKPTQVKRTKKRHPVTMPKRKTGIAKAASAHTGTTKANSATAAKRKALELRVNEEEAVGNGSEAESIHEIQETQEPKNKSRSVPKAKPKKAHTDVDDAEMEVGQTPAVAQSHHALDYAKIAAPKVIKKATALATTKTNVIEEHPKDQALGQLDSEMSEADEVAGPAVKKTKTNNTTRQPSRSRPGNTFRRRAGSASDTERGDPNLRRKLGDITHKFENIDLKYRNLKEVGIAEASANVEKLRKQCEVTTQASNDLIASLKEELATQAPLALEARKLKKQMQTQQVETAQLRTTATELAASLTAAQNEIKALQAKLAAARSSSVPAENLNARTPGSAMKPAGPTRSVVGSHNEAVQAAQTAQLKEDLYGDLTGLIIRSVKRSEDGDTYDCIQTGRNGTLHFKLFVDAEDAKTASFEETDFLYTPLLDASRDRDMIDLMPTYLTEEITFARQNAAKFYGRVLDTLTKRRAEE